MMAQSATKPIKSVKSTKSTKSAKSNNRCFDAPRIVITPDFEREQFDNLAPSKAPALLAPLGKCKKRLKLPDKGRNPPIFEDGSWVQPTRSKLYKRSRRGFWHQPRGRVRSKLKPSIATAICISPDRLTRSQHPNAQTA